MNIHVKIGAGLLVLGAVAVLAYKFAWPHLESRQQIAITDARATKGHIAIGVDNWIGYFPLCSDEMRKRMRASGYVLRCEDDKADYAARLAHLKSGKLQFAVATVDAYLANGSAAGFPGAVVAVIDESKGGDALVGWKDKAPSVESLKAPSTPRVAFTPGSPSEHLLRSTAVHFDIPAMRGGKGAWRVETNGSQDALKVFLDRKTDAAVLWEPDVSRALATPGVVRLLSTAETRRLVVDVLIAGRGVLQQDPAMVQTLLQTYFDVLRHYQDNPERLAKDVAAETGLAAAQVKTMLAGVAWANLADNFQAWLGSVPGSDGAVDVIQSTLRVLLASGALAANPLPDGDPYRILNSQFVAAAYTAAATGQESTAQAGAARLDQRFAALDEAQWDQLRVVGSLKSLSIGFQSGASELSYEGKTEIDEMMQVLRHYPGFRIRIRGHTALAGDAEENRLLSQERAEAVARYLAVTYNLDTNRTRVQGMGASQPLPRLPGESDRAYHYRLPRVEVSLLSSAF